MFGVAWGYYWIMNRNEATAAIRRLQEAGARAVKVDGVGPFPIDVAIAYVVMHATRFNRTFSSIEAA